MPIQTRLATPADAAALSDLAVRTFRDTFAAENTAEDMAMYLDKAYSVAQFERELGDATMTTLVVESDAGLAAFAQLRLGSAPPGRETIAAMEIWRFYVDRPFHGQGMAAELMARVDAHAAAQGAASLWLGVWERNTRGIAFYRKMGFVDIGEQEFVLGTDRQTDRVMMRAVTPVRVFYHGTRAHLHPDDLLTPGNASNYTVRKSPWIYFSETLNAAAWGAELAKGDGPSRIYVVEPTGPFVDDPNLTDKKFPGNPTKSYRSAEPLRVVRELLDWVGHTAEEIEAMKTAIAGLEPIDD
jgi:rifampin ADP-ribosylating transferase